MSLDELAKWKMRESAHLNGGRAWFGYEYQCLEQPRLRRLDRYTRANRSVASTWLVDGVDCESLDDALERLKTPPVIGEDELALLQLLSPEFLSKADLDALDLDWRNRRDSLSKKGLIWWEAGKVRITELGLRARAASSHPQEQEGE